MDSHHAAQELTSLILQSSSSTEIATTLASIDAFLHTHSSDQTRPFFSLTFPVLICKAFGFAAPATSSSQGWIDQFHSGHLAEEIFDLFSPSGPLIAAIFAADRNSLVRYVFPTERLPEWVRIVIGSERSRSFLTDICPLFQSRVKEDSSNGSFYVQLNVFEYFWLWFAYYPVCKAKGENSDDVQGVSRNRKRSKLEKWAYSIPVLQGSAKSAETSMKEANVSIYFRLLYSYLRVFVPRELSGSFQQNYRGSLLQYPSKEVDSNRIRAEFVVHTFINFWLVENDFSPVSTSIQKTLGLNLGLRNLLDEMPPCAGLGGVIGLLIEYLNSKNVGIPDEFRPRMHISSDAYVLSQGIHLETWNSLLQRPIYRYLLRTFEFCPIGSSMKNIHEVVELWSVYLEPWKINLKGHEEIGDRGTKEEVSDVDSASKDERDEGSLKNTYSRMWLDYVVSNYLFYTTLVLHFFGFAHKFLHVDVEAVIRMTIKILNVLVSSRELLDVLKKIDASYQSKQAGTASTSTDPTNKYVSSIQDQLQDWQDGFISSKNVADGSLVPNSVPRLEFFSDEEDGGPQLLQLLILRAEMEVETQRGEKRHRNFEALDHLKSMMVTVFGPGRNSKMASPPDPSESPRTRNDVFTPKHPGVGNSAWSDVTYKGDWMKRPVTDDEVVWFARLLVRLSDWLNEMLKLGHHGSITVESHEQTPGTGLTYINMSNDNNVVGGAQDALKFVLHGAGLWFLVAVQALQRFLRDHNCRINLRFLASKKVVLFMLVFLGVSLLKMGFRRCPHAGSTVSLT